METLEVKFPHEVNKIKMHKFGDFMVAIQFRKLFLIQYIFCDLLRGCHNNQMSIEKKIDLSNW